MGAEAVDRLTLEVVPEADGRFLAELPGLPGAMAYGSTRDEAVANVHELALRILAEQRSRSDLAVAAQRLLPPPTPRGSWSPTKARRVLRALTRIGWWVRRSREAELVLAWSGWSDVLWPFTDDEMLGPAALARIARRTSLTPEDVIEAVTSPFTPLPSRA